MRIQIAIVTLLPLAFTSQLTSAQSLEHATALGTVANPAGLSTQVAGIGDVNGDSLDDFAVWGWTQNLAPIKTVRVHSGADGTLLHSSQIGNVLEEPYPGFAVLADLDGDGIRDYACGGTRSVGPLVEDFVRVYSGATSSALYDIPYPSGPTGTSTQPSFGQGIGSVGDLDGDGVHDLAVSAPFDTFIFGGYGGIYLFSGVDGSSIRRVDAPQGGFGFGLSITDIGDANGDGVDDLLAGAPFASPLGSLYCVSGVDGSMLYDLAGTFQGDSFATHVEAMDDLNGDGVADFCVGTQHAGGLPLLFARVTTYSGATGSVIFSTDYDNMGAQQIAGLSSTRDSNQDGIRDLLIATFSDLGDFPGLGQVLHVSGADGSVLSIQEGDREGMGVASVTSLGDLTGNGHADWVVGHYSTLGLDRAGLVQIMHGGCLVQETPSCTVPANSTGLASSLQAVACGDASSQGQMQLRMTDLPAGEFGYVLMAPQAGSFPVAGSTLCLGGAITRLNSPTTGIFRSDDSGYASRLVDWGAFPEGAMVLPGSTWHFQVMHRDRGLATPFHLTHALAITF